MAYMISSRRRSNSESFYKCVVNGAGPVLVCMYEGSHYFGSILSAPDFWKQLFSGKPRGHESYIRTLAGAVLQPLC